MLSSHAKGTSQKSLSVSKLFRDGGPSGVTVVCGGSCCGDSGGSSNGGGILKAKKLSWHYHERINGGLLM